jgi:hypothetical protein
VTTTELAVLYAELETALNDLPASRYRALALTALEESGMWASRATPVNSQPNERENA